MLWSGLGFRNWGHLQKISSPKKIVNCSMQSGQSPPQSVVKCIRAYGNALYKFHTITITITINTLTVRYLHKFTLYGPNVITSFCLRFLEYENFCESRSSINYITHLHVEKGWMSKRIPKVSFLCIA